MSACREGGDAIEQALRALDRSFFAVLYRDCLRSLRDDDSARDLVQETFIKVWQRCASFRGDSELLPWIRSILRHAILDHVRRPEREIASDLEEELSRLPSDPGRAAPEPASPLDAMRRRELGECFSRCWKEFQTAAPAHAAVMSWIVEDGMSNDQISALLGRSPGATREFISQCRKRARIHMAEWYALAFGTR